jgi:lipoate---protein ligase
MHKRSYNPMLLRYKHTEQISGHNLGTWRLLRLEVNDAFTNMAIDEAIVNARIADSIPNTLRLYRWNPSAVSIGRFQDITIEAHVNNCREKGIDIVRRITGGGTVYHDSQKEITYSVVARERDFGTIDVIQAYNKICSGIIEGAKILGVNASFSPGDPRNCPTVSINEKKISGSAQYHKSGVLLQHGTFLLDVDLESMFTLLRVPWARNISDVICVAKDKITSIEKELNRHVDHREAAEALIQGFCNALSIELQEGKLTDTELALASELRNEKYTKDAWNLKGKA